MESHMLDLALVTLAGGGVGFLSGVFGVGGGFLIVPVLNIALGIRMDLAVGAGACQGLGPATTSLLARRIALSHVRLPLTIAGGLFVGVFSGTNVLQLAKQHEAITIPWTGNSVPPAELVVLVTYFFLLLGVGLFALWEVSRPHKPELAKTVLTTLRRIPPCAEFPEFEQPRMSIPVLSWFGLVIGFLAGLLGMSGGLILLPGLIYLFGIRTHQAIFSSLVIVWLVAAQSTIAHAWYGHVKLPLVVALLFGGTVGARLGSEVSEKLGGRQLRQSFGWLLLAAAALIGGRLGRLMFD